LRSSSIIDSVTNLKEIQQRNGDVTIYKIQFHQKKHNEKSESPRLIQPQNILKIGNGHPK